jgi:hypothetical protein
MEETKDPLMNSAGKVLNKGKGILQTYLSNNSVSSRPSVKPSTAIDS